MRFSEITADGAKYVILKQTFSETLYSRPHMTAYKP